jgi:hypothetical protein
MKMKIGLAAAMLACVAVPAVAQEHWTEGPVWECSSYRTNPGMFDTYMKYIRTHAIPVFEESKKAGLILDYKTFVKTPSSPDDWDFMICSAYPNYGRALDYSKADEDKADAIREKHWATADEDKQEQLASPRLEMRTFLGTTFIREVAMRPPG